MHNPDDNWTKSRVPRGLKPDVRVCEKDPDLRIGLTERKQPVVLRKQLQEQLIETSFIGVFSQRTHDDVGQIREYNDVNLQKYVIYQSPPMTMLKLASV